MRYLVFALFLWIQPLFAQRINVDRGEAKKAYHYLNDFRMNPKKHGRAIRVNNLRGVTQTRLVWNPTLAKVAEERAKDMARRNYFDHTDPDGYGPNYHISKAGYTLNPDWLKKRSTNNFESIGAGHPTAVDGIKSFIIGKGSPGFMHRKHMLGLDDWNASLQDVGIGFVRVKRGKGYATYLCVIIAKHDW